MRIQAGKLRTAVLLSLALLVTCVSRGRSLAKALGGPGSERQLQELVHSVEGPDLFRAYCAPCHGLDAKGHGPAAAALKARVADLTVLAKNNGGEFPSNRARRTVLGYIREKSYYPND